MEPFAGADPGFQVRGAHLKKFRRAEGDAKILGVFRVKNHAFTPKNHIFSNYSGVARQMRPPPLDPPLVCPAEYALYRLPCDLYFVYVWK